MYAIFKREFKAYFYSPIAYVLIGLFILISSIFFLSNIYGGYADFNSNLSQMNFVLLFILPILTMRLLSEERKNGTEVLLVTSPVNVTGIVVGKYLAAVAVFLVMTALTSVYQFILFGFGNPAVAQLIGGYVAFILLGCCFIAVGLFASSLTESQIIAAVTGIISLLVMWLMGYISSFTTGFVSKVLSWFSILERYDDFNIGILNLGSIIYYISFIFVFLFLAIRVIEKRRWSKG